MRAQAYARAFFRVCVNCACACMRVCPYLIGLISAERAPVHTRAMLCCDLLQRMLLSGRAVPQVWAGLLCISGRETSRLRHARVSACLWAAQLVHRRPMVWRFTLAGPSMLPCPCTATVLHVQCARSRCWSAQSARTHACVKHMVCTQQVLERTECTHPCLCKTVCLQQVLCSCLQWNTVSCKATIILCPCEFPLRIDHAGKPQQSHSPPDCLC